MSIRATTPHQRSPFPPWMLGANPLLEEIGRNSLYQSFREERPPGYRSAHDLPSRADALSIKRSRACRRKQRL